jgi:protein involved in polysaccharide export with SLBB domain
MKRTGTLWGLGLGLAAVALAGCSTTNRSVVYPDMTPASVVVTNAMNPSLLQPSTDPFVLGPGDQLDIERVGLPQSRALVTVGLDGKIYYSLFPGIDVWGMSVSQAQQAVEASLAQSVQSSRVAVSLRAVNSKRVWLLGRMNRPGIYPLTGPTTLLEALALAGGTARNASAITTADLGDLRHSFVMRQGKALPVDFTALLQEGDMSQNIYLQPDDFVFIPSSISQEVYVLGAVLTPRTVPYQDPMTLMSAIAAANGPGADSYTSHVAIVRGSLTKPEMIVVDFNAISVGKIPNVRLEPGDIVYVPLSPYRFITDYADLIVTTFVRTWSANEAIQTLVGQGQVSVAVPVGPKSTSGN